MLAAPLHHGLPPSTKKKQKGEETAEGALETSKRTAATSSSAS